MSRSYSLRALMLAMTALSVALGAAVYVTGPSAEERLATRRFGELTQLESAIVNTHRWNVKERETYDAHALADFSHSGAYRYIGLKSGAIARNDFGTIDIKLASVSVRTTIDEGPTGGRGSEWRYYWERPLTDIGVGFRRNVRHHRLEIEPVKTWLEVGAEAEPICTYVVEPMQGEIETRVRRCHIGWLVNGEWQLVPPRFTMAFVRELKRRCGRCQGRRDWQDFLYVSASYWESDEESNRAALEATQQVFESVAGKAEQIAGGKDDSEWANCLSQYLNELRTTN